MLTLIPAIISLAIHALVVFYGWKMYKILNPVRYWSSAWLLFLLGNLLIFIRRSIAVFVNTPTLIELLIQIVVSFLLLAFVQQLNRLYTKYFSNGLDLEAWIEQQELQKKK